MKASLATTGNQKDMRLAFGVHHNRPAPAPAKVLRQEHEALGFIGKAIGLYANREAA